MHDMVNSIKRPAEAFKKILIPWDKLETFILSSMHGLVQMEETREPHDLQADTITTHKESEYIRAVRHQH